MTGAFAEQARTRKPCARTKTFDDGRVVRCGGHAEPGLDYCEPCAVRTKKIPAAKLCESAGHPWEIGSESCPRCGRKMTD